MKIHKNGPGAIVLGGNFVGLGIIRSLGQRGIPVWVIDADRSKSIAQFSRFTKRFIESREPITELLLREGREHELNGWVLFPVTDECVEILSADREPLSSIYRVTTPRWEVTKFALDKRLTYGRADELGIPTPWTLTSRSLADLEAQDLLYPVILKPAVNHHFFPQTNLKALVVESAADLGRQYAQMNRYISADEILVQERIPGGGESQFSYCAACKDGRVYAGLVAQRRRQYPLEFGNASSFVETTTQSFVEAAGRQFLESIEFDGIGEVEFKFDSRDGQYKILDVNPRAWGWHTLGNAAGIDFTYLLWRQAVGLDVMPNASPRDAAWMREITDIVALLQSPNRAGEVKELLLSIRHKKFEFATLSRLDPLPFFAEFVLWLASGISRQKKARNFIQSSSANAKPENAQTLVVTEER